MSPARQATAQKSLWKAKPSRLTGSSRKASKTSKVLELLKRLHGATLPELMKKSLAAEAAS